MLLKHSVLNTPVVPVLLV